jgi:hypothetical protein
MSGLETLILTLVLMIVIALLLIYVEKLRKEKEVQQTKIVELNNDLKLIKQNHQTKVSELNNDLKFLKQNSREYYSVAERNEWFKRILSLSFKNEVEVEVKFVHPLLHFLGFKEDEYEMRVPTNVHAGRQVMTAEADWVVYAQNFSEAKRPVFVIEVKRSSQILDSSVIEQARSYAFALNTVAYMVTNGKGIRVFERGVPEDKPVMAFKIAELPEKWTTLSTYITRISKNRNS